MKTKLFLTGLLTCISIGTQAQSVQTEEPKGKAIVQVFGNFHSGFGENNNNFTSASVIPRQSHSWILYHWTQSHCKRCYGHW